MNVLKMNIVYRWAVYGQSDHSHLPAAKVQCTWNSGTGKFINSKQTIFLKGIIRKWRHANINFFIPLPLSAANAKFKKQQHRKFNHEKKQLI